MLLILSLRSIVESKKDFRQHRVSKLWVLKKACIEGTLVSKVPLNYEEPDHLSSNEKI